MEKALHLADLGNHVAAIKELREMLVKEPSSAPYAQNLLGVEYAQNQQFAEAQSSFEEAVRLMPHESINHSNLGFALAVAGDFEVGRAGSAHRDSARPGQHQSEDIARHLAPRDAGPKSVSGTGPDGASASDGHRRFRSCRLCHCRCWSRALCAA